MADSNYYSIQKQACKKFFARWETPCYMTTDHICDITGFNALQVVECLKRIVNGESFQVHEETFYLNIESTPGNPIKFKFVPRPLFDRDEPGNCFLSRVEKFSNRMYGTELEKGYKEVTLRFASDPSPVEHLYLEWLPITCLNLFPKMKEEYKHDTRRFASDLKKLFKDNKAIVPPCTAEVYMVLLFEIARRQVVQEQSTEKKWKFDKLPIGIAIARIVTLLEARECKLDDVFSFEGKFQCFFGEPEQRKKAIEEINSAYEEYQVTLQVTRELNEMFT